MNELLKNSFVRFAFSGASSFVLDIALFQIFCIVLRENFYTSSYVFLASIFARIFSAVYNYVINSYLVFKSKKNFTHSATRYFLLAVVQGFTSSTLTAFIFDFVKCDLELYIKIPVDVFLFFASYFIQKKFVY